MKSLRQKLNSRTGASISFALLLFLVCAVVGSVVLVAGTSAAGRVSRLPEMDQRYYSVTSAVGLLHDILSDQTVTVTQTTTTTTQMNADGTAIPDSSEVGDPIVSPNKTNAILSDAAKWLLENPNSATAHARQLTVTGPSETNLPTVTVNETLSQDGTLMLDVYNTDGSYGTYKVRLTLKADIHKSIDEKTSMSTPKNVNVGTDSVTYQVTETKVSTVTMDVTWQVTDIETINGAIQNG